jgi:hypothetical protein
MAVSKSVQDNPAREVSFTEQAIQGELITKSAKIKRIRGIGPPIILPDPQLSLF